MSTNLTYPSVSTFPQSSILLQKREGRDSTPTETALGAFLNAAAQPLKTPGAYVRCAGIWMEVHAFSDGVGVRVEV